MEKLHRSAKDVLNRQRAMLKLLKEGKPYKEIANEVGVAYSTVACFAQKHGGKNRKKTSALTTLTTIHEARKQKQSIDSLDARVTQKEKIVSQLEGRVSQLELQLEILYDEKKEKNTKGLKRMVDVVKKVNWSDIQKRFYAEHVRKPRMTRE